MTHVIHATTRSAGDVAARPCAAGLSRTVAVAVAVCVAVALAAVPGRADGVSVSIGLGAQVLPDYFGAATYRARPLGYGALHDIEFGDFQRDDPGPREDRTGFAFGGAVRVSHARLAEDNPELAGLSDVPWSLETGAVAGYSTGTLRGFADLRYGVIGHNSFVGEIGGDVILRPGANTTITLGPRVQIGSDAYAETYFGVTATEAAASSFAAFAADGGILSAGLQLNLVHRFDDDWSIRGRLDLRDLQGSAADSPITAQGSGFQARAGVTLVRRFSLGD